MKRSVILFVAFALSLEVFAQQARFFATTEQPIIANGKLDRVEELVNRVYHQPVMNDGVRLWLDVCYPEFRDAMDVQNLQIRVAGQSAILAGLVVADSGLRYFIYKNQSDVHQLPFVLSRTPYGAYWWHQQGHIFALMGFACGTNDMRGKMNSEGTYYPMYSDGWKKTPYINFGHSLDITPTYEANEHQDGYEVVRYVADSLRWDTDGDGQITSADGLLCNGNIGMQGASAVGNSQLQAAAVENVNLHPRGLKCLFPVNATLEYQRYAGFQNGCFRSGLIGLWILGQMATDYFAPYDTLDDLDQSVRNNLKTLRDYGVNYHDYFDENRYWAAITAVRSGVRFWTTDNRAYYPNSAFRATMDASVAYLNSSGQSDPAGNVSRYTNLDIPTYHLSGWWDIFSEGQLETWRLMRKHSPMNKQFQKLTIGPWSHNTNGNLTTGDQTYPDNAADITSVSLDGMETQNIIRFQQQEMREWFKKFLTGGEAPVFRLPARTQWQQFQDPQAGNFEVLAPAFDYETSYEKWYNYFNASDVLDSFPLIVHELTNNTYDTQFVALPVRSDYLIYYLNDEGWRLHNSEYMINRPEVNWDENFGTEPLRFYVPGPVNDGVAYNQSVGNYWMGSDTFPLRNENRQKLYFHQNGTLDWNAPVSDEGEQRWCADPLHPVYTHGGNNMEETTPDQSRSSLGQMNFRDPAYVDQVLERPLLDVDGEMMDDLLEYESGTLEDSFTTVGYPKFKLWMKSRPQSSPFPELAAWELYARVLDVTPDGKELFVLEGSLNSRYMEWARTIALTDTEDLNAAITNPNANQYYELDFRAQPMAYAFGKGHRIKVLISGSNNKRFSICDNVPINDQEYTFRSNLVPMGNYYQGVFTEPTVAINTLKFSDQMQAYIDFPYLGATPVINAVKDFNPSINQIELFPNPATSVVNIRASIRGDYSVEIFNEMGQVVFSQENVAESLAVNIRSFNSGMYLVSMSTADGRRTLKKLVIH